MESSKLNVQCTYPWCQKYFETEKEMKYHKRNDSDHYYCKNCDVDCEDWKHLTVQKVEKMAPWLDGRMKHNKDEQPAHIVCEFCGIDFKSFGGRKKHRAGNHPAAQNVGCPDPRCDSIFERASGLIAHFEDGACRFISSRMYLANVQHKHVLNLVMQKPDEFVQGLHVNKTYAKSSDTPGLIEDDDTTQDGEEGGINLLDQEDEAQKGGYKPLKAEVDLIDMNLPLTRSNLETWPRLPGQAPSQLTESVRSMSIGSPPPSISGKSASEYASDITSRRGGKKIYTESYPSLSSPRYASSMTEDDDGVSVSTSVMTSPKSRPGAWTTGSTSHALFKDAEPTPPAGDWRAIMDQRAEKAVAEDTTNLFHSRFYDPASKDYNVDVFLHSVIGKYCCPFPGCGDTYDAATDLGGHLQNAHLQTEFRCPLCSKLFQKASALIGHAESAGSCRVKDTTKFDKLLDEISGGFLKAEHFKEPKIYKTGAAAVKAGDPTNGVMSTKFIAKMPEDR